MLRLIRIYRKKIGRLQRLAEIYLQNRKLNLSQNKLGGFNRDELQTLKGVKTFVVEGNRIFTELANGQAEISFYQDGVVGVKLYGGTRKEPITTGAIHELPKAAEIEVCKEGNDYHVEYQKYRAVIKFDPFAITIYNNTRVKVCAGLQTRFSVDKMVVWKELKEEHFYAGGEQTGPLDKRGRYLEYWNTDAFGYHNDQTIHTYCSIPFVIATRDSATYGLFIDEPCCGFFDLGREEPDRLYFGVNQSFMRYYIIPGETIKEVVEKYTGMTGRMPLPPLWSLGFHISKWSYFPVEKVYKIAETLRRKKIPADVVHLDIDYMDGFRVFTFDPDFFPHPRKMAEKLASMGFKTVAILDPGVKKDDEYQVYREGQEKGYFTKNADGETVTGEVWPKETVFPDFYRSEVRSWWSRLVKDFLTEYGVSGIWNDMNEPSELTDLYRTLPESARHRLDDGREVSHRFVHNIYGFLEVQAAFAGFREAAPELRPFLLSRSGFPGVQRYAAIWTGDNRSRFQHLALAIPMNCNLGLSGVAFVGNDVGGFNEHCTAELFARWIAMGAFTPFYRVHSICNARPQEPWTFGAEVEKISREFITLRYRLLPYIYNQFYQAHTTGLPVMRPLVLDYQDDPETATIDDEYLFGPDLLVAPVTEEGRLERKVYLPRGSWFDFWTDRRIQGGSRITAPTPLDGLPLYVRADAVIPVWQPRQSTSVPPPKELIFEIYPVVRGELTYYEDDGTTTRFRNGEYNLLKVEHEQNLGQLAVRISYLTRGYDSGRENLILRLHGVKELSRIIWGGEEMDPDQWCYEAGAGLLEIVLPDTGDNHEVFVKQGLDE